MAPVTPTDAEPGLAATAMDGDEEEVPVMADLSPADECGLFAGTAALIAALVLLVTGTIFLIVYWMLGISLGLQAPYVYPAG